MTDDGLWNVPATTTDLNGQRMEYTATGDLQAKTEYDTQDRTVRVTLADGSTTRNVYTISSHDGVPMLETKVTDALGRTAESYTDEKGRNRETVQHAGGEDITVKYAYNPVNELKHAYDKMFYIADNKIVPGHSFAYDEFNIVAFENHIRRSEGNRNRRTAYSGVLIPKVYNRVTLANKSSHKRYIR